ncbi:hypothetical protein [Luteipulveratus mongoliensis]|uniref:Uncharacterized protein n=1 Tax=Luteipulveratus mongoliensis TaxID=571913 RepID=A0A0K1JNZ0_9MICO|nr:hypothetical protein [Luteipulveratus mongoliensis]AKU18285.1 hypothetical protein VV02_24635 [Luteipulveratus mongoliensis]
MSSGGHDGAGPSNPLQSGGGGGDLEQLLRDAFEARAAEVTPGNLDTSREHTMRELLAEPAPRELSRRWLYAAGAGLAAAAVAGAIVIAQQPQGNARFASDPPVGPNATVTVGSPTNGGDQTGQPNGGQPSGQPNTSPGSTGPSGAPSTLGGTTAPTSGTTSAPRTAATGTAGTSSVTTPGETPGTETSSDASPTIAGGSSGPLSVPSTFVAQGEMSSIPMPSDMTYEVLESSDNYIKIHVSDYMQLTRYLNNNTPLGGWPRDDRGYHSPNSTMAASSPSSDGSGDGGVFTLFVDPDDQGPAQTSEPSGEPSGDSTTEPTATP